MKFKTLFSAFMLSYFSLLSQTIQNDIVVPIDSLSSFIPKHLLKSDGSMFFIGNGDKHQPSSVIKVNYFGINLNYKDGELTLASKKEIPSVLNNMFTAKSMLWLDGESKINLISMEALSSKPQIGSFYRIYPKKYIISDEFEIISEMIDTNNFQVVANNAYPPIVETNDEKICVPVYGPNRFGDSVGLYFTYYTKECKVAGYKYIQKIDSTTFKGIDSLLIVNSFIPKDMRFTPDGGAWIFSNNRYSIGTWATGASMVSGSSLIKFDSENKIQWRVLDTDIFTSEKVWLNSAYSHGDSIIVVGSSNTKYNEPGNAKIVILDSKTGEILKVSSFGSFKNIIINGVTVLSDGSYMIVGSFNRTFEDNSEAQRKYYVAKLSKNLEFEWEIACTNSDPTTILFGNTIELENNDLIIYGHNDYNFMAATLKSTAGAFDMKMNNNTILSVSAERGRLTISADLSEAIIGEAEIKVFDINGNTILSQTVNTQLRDKVTIENLNLVSGAYIVQISNSEFNLNKKFVIE